MFINNKGAKVIKDLVERIVDGYGEDNDLAAADGYALASILKYIIDSESATECE